MYILFVYGVCIVDGPICPVKLAEEQISLTLVDPAKFGRPAKKNDLRPILHQKTLPRAWNSVNGWEYVKVGAEAGEARHRMLLIMLISYT